MRRAGVLVAALLMLVADMAAANPPTSSLRPRPRPPELTQIPAADPAPAAATTATATAAAAAATPTAPPVTASSLRPRPRPAGLELAAAAPAPEAPAKPAKKGKTSKKGSVCGDADIKGEVLAPVKSKVKGCGIAEPVSITSVAGVKLSQPATLDCSAAIALNRWMQDVVQPLYRKTPVVQINVAAHYICRPRNNVRGAKISEHGRGKAIDVSGFVLSDGRTVTVLRDWGKTMRAAYKGACGLFGTTLGPGSDGYHEDHMHLDTASYRSGPYCR